MGVRLSQIYRENSQWLYQFDCVSLGELAVLGTTNLVVLLILRGTNFDSKSEYYPVRSPMKTVRVAA